MPSIVITRKISLSISKDQDVKKAWETLRGWNEAVFRAANYAATHRYIQENLKEFFYMTSDFKIKLLDSAKDPLGVFNTSPMNTTYRLLSSKFKGEVPMAIISAVNNNVSKTFGTQKKEFFSGKRSLATYRRDIPIPVPVQAMRQFIQTEDKKNYQFEIFGLKFQTFFGRDKSGNKSLMDMAFDGTHKLCDSSIAIDGKDLFFLAVFKMERQATACDPEKIAFATLSPDVPIHLKIGEKSIFIGNREEFLYRRMAINGALQRAQANCRYSKGGHGRSRKMQSIDRFHDLEKNYIHTRQHQYTSRVIELLQKNSTGSLVLQFSEEPPCPHELSKRERTEWYFKNGFLLRNWSYRGLLQMIEYKCNRAGIKVTVETQTKATSAD